MIVGIDEVGRGPWAGPLVMGAVVLGTEIEGLTDSKKLSKKRRELLNTEIIKRAKSFGLGWVSSHEIDEMGLSVALRECCRRALKQIDVPFHEIIIDGTVNFLTETPLENHVTLMKKADLLVPSVSAASIIAKVARDDFMKKQEAAYPEYGFSCHVGYGTAQHRAAIERFGVTPLHRKSFAPIAKLETNSSVAELQTTKQIGNSAETVAANELVRRGFQIIARNYRTKIAEIDIIATKDDTMYFVEVKHRKTADQGGGIAAITAKKLRKMRLGAEVFSKAENVKDQNLQLAVITTTGNPPVFEDFLALE